MSLIVTEKRRTIPDIAYLNWWFGDKLVEIKADEFVDADFKFILIEFRWMAGKWWRPTVKATDVDTNEFCRNGGRDNRKRDVNKSLRKKN